MKKLFGRDKPKIPKASATPREAAGAASIDSPRRGPSHDARAVLSDGGARDRQYLDAARYMADAGVPPTVAGMQPAMTMFTPPQRSGSLGLDLSVPEAVSRQSSDPDRWEVISSFDRRADSPQPSARPPPAHGGSYSSLASLPPGAAYAPQHHQQQQQQHQPPQHTPQQQQPPYPLPPRSSSPYSTSSQTYSRSERTGKTLKKSPPGPAPGSAVAALGILSSLNPTAVSSGPQSSPPHGAQQFWDDGASERFVREERKEKRGFFHRERSPDKGKGRIRDGEDDGMIRMIGYIVANGTEDWGLVLELCERVSQNEAQAKEAAKAIRREFKYGEPKGQMAAAKLWAIMLNNCPEHFAVQCGTRKFLDTIEDLLDANRSPPVVRDRVLEILAGATYQSVQRRQDGKRHEKDGFLALWRKVKPPEKPDQGVPFDTEDAMFNPPTPRRTSVYSNPAQMPLEPLRSPGMPLEANHGGHKRRHSQKTSRNRVIPPEEDMRRLFQECKVGRGNASLLSEALKFAKPQELNRKGIIREFFIKCQASQEFIAMQIPWATAGAERSREMILSGQILEDAPGEATPEERLLAALLGANEDLIEALRMYDDLERIAAEREAEERSRKETRMDRTRPVYHDENGSIYLEPPAQAGGGSSSRSSSPSSPSSSPAASSLNAAHAHATANGHPLPPIPGHGSPQVPLLIPPALLAAHGGSPIPPPPPLHQPHPMQGGLNVQPERHRFGPRSPAGASVRSRTPSPDRLSAAGVQMMSAGGIGPGGTHVPPPPPLVPQYGHHRASPQPSMTGTAEALGRLHLADRVYVERDEDEEDVMTPMRPSAKALGKRRAMEADEPAERFDPDDMFRDSRQGEDQRSDSGRSDDSEGHAPHVRYAYDAVKERYDEIMLRERARAAEGRPTVQVNGVH